MKNNSTGGGTMARLLRKLTGVCLALAVCVCLLAGCMHSHSYGDWEEEKPATCTEKGEKVRTCDCGEEDTKSVPMLDHQYESQITSPAGCGGQGVNTFTCAECGDSYEEPVEPHEYSATELYQMYEDSVGEIITYDQRGNELALGTGFVAQAEDRVITNYHVIDGAYSAEITFGEKTYEVDKLLAYDKELDIAVLQLEGARLEPAQLCEKDHEVGATVYALGNSQGMTSTFSDGMITATVREIDGVQYVQHDAPISSGNSGGPLFNVYGEVIGINTWTVRDSQNLNFAIHMSELNELTYGSELTMAQYYEKECSVFGRLTDYVVAEGTYDDGSYSLDLGEYAAAYWWANYEPGSEEFWLFYAYEVDGDGFCVSLILNSDMDGKYEWIYVDEFDNSMIGTVTAASFGDSSTLSYYDSTMAGGADKADVQDMASALMVLLCLELDDSFAEIGVTAEDLGFVNF